MFGRARDMSCHFTIVADLFHALAPATKVHQDVIEGEAIEPGCELALAAKGTDFS